MNLKRLVPISLIALSLSIFAPISLFITQAQAEVVEVEGQGDCPGGNDGWQRHLIVDIAAKRTYTRCVRIEVVPVPTPTPTPTATPTPTPTPSSTPTPTASSTPTPTASSAPVTTTRKQLQGLQVLPTLIQIFQLAVKFLVREYGALVKLLGFNFITIQTRQTGGVHQFTDQTATLMRVKVMATIQEQGNGFECALRILGVNQFLGLLHQTTRHKNQQRWQKH
jgi:hypothetical protein